MFIRIAILALTVCSAQIAKAQNVVIIAFEDQQIVNSGEKQNMDLYYVLAYEGSRIEQGELVQISRRRSNPTATGVALANYTLADDGQLTIRWNPIANERFGQTERGQLTPKPKNGIRYEYFIKQHDDRSQIGEKMNVRIIALNQVPDWVKKALWNYRQTKMSPQERVHYHRLQAEQLRATQQIIDAYLNTIN